MIQVDLEQKKARTPAEELLETAHKATGGILSEGATKLKHMGYYSLRRIGDHGGFSIEYPQFFLTANKMLNKGSEVSSETRFVHYIIKRNKALMIYVRQNGKFYIFDPREIIKPCNHRITEWYREDLQRNLVMYNWDIQLGRELQT